MQVTPQPAIRSMYSRPATSRTRDPRPSTSATGCRFTTGRKCAASLRRSSSIFMRLSSESRAFYRDARAPPLASIGRTRQTRNVPSPARDVILLEGIQVPAALGVTAAERRMRRPVRLDLEVERDLRAAGRSDSIRQTIHYKRVFEVVEDVAANQQHKLVEALADRIARAVLAKFDADAVTVSVRKPTPIAGVLESAGVRVTRRREDLD